MLRDYGNFDRFVRRTDGCWLWTGTRNSRGYGQIRIAGQLYYAHRLAWEREHRVDVPDGLSVLHSCDVRNCVRPEHLFVGTAADNSRDMRAKGRGVASLSAEDVQAIRMSFQPSSEVARRFGINKSTVNRIRAGKAWRHLAGAF